MRSILGKNTVSSSNRCLARARTLFVALVAFLWPYPTFFNLSELNNLTLASGLQSLKVSKLLQPAFVLPPILIYLDIEFQVNLSDSIGSDTQ